MLKRVAQNKYKLMVLIMAAYLCVDVWQHTGQARVLFPKNYPGAGTAVLKPQGKTMLQYTDKSWKKGVNTRRAMSELDAGIAGFECDLYFNAGNHTFEVHHDADQGTGFGFDELLKIYRDKKMRSCIWLDIKNLSDSNQMPAFLALAGMRNQYNLEGRILVESHRADLLAVFSDGGFFTAYYVPFFNPYKMNEAALTKMADSVRSVISTSKINALSGYYFQQDFLNHYFPLFPFVTWADRSHWSLVNYLFLRKVATAQPVYILLQP